MKKEAHTAYIIEKFSIQITEDHKALLSLFSPSEDRFDFVLNPENPNHKQENILEALVEGLSLANSQLVKKN